MGRFAGAGGGVPHSACRVAQAGNGNSTDSGTGISGWLTNMVPGLASVARVRWLGGRKPYSGRPASAASRRPTTLMLEFDTIRRSTSLAVCWAPIRMIPRLRPRSAMSSRTSLIGLLPSRGCVLVELVDHGEQQAARAGRFLPGGLGGQHDADDEPLGPFAEVVQVDDGDLLVAGGDLPGAGVGQVGADEVSQWFQGGPEPADEGVDRAHPGDGAGPLGAGGVVGEPFDDDVDEFVVGAAGGAVDADAAVLAGG